SHLSHQCLQRRLNPLLHLLHLLHLLLSSRSSESSCHCYEYRLHGQTARAPAPAANDVRQVPV
ncbi:unnamed protein product, partial [Closterium sp. NIES-53]